MRSFDGQNGVLTQRFFEMMLRRVDFAKLTPEQMVDYFEALVADYPIASIEDGLAEDDMAGWKLATERLGGKIHEHARKDRFFELYGIFPSLSVRENLVFHAAYHGVPARDRRPLGTQGRRRAEGRLAGPGHQVDTVDLPYG